MELTDIEEVGGTLAPVERAALALDSSKAEKHLRELAVKYASITEVKDKAGREQAHNAAMELTRARTAIDKAAKEAREDATKFSKAVIAEAARLTAIVEPEETRLKAARDAWDAEQARIKAEAEARERARVLAITERITAIKNFVMLANNCRTSDRVAELQAKLSGVELSGFEEFADEAAAAHAYATHHLAKVLAERNELEAEAARLKAEQEAEAARLKAEREEFLRLQAQAKAEAEAAEAKVRAAAEELAQQRAEFERQLAEQAKKNEPAEEPTYVLAPPEPAFEEFAKPVEVPPGVTLIKGEVGTVDSGIAIVEGRRAPVASAIVLAVAEFFHTDAKTAARWITERASEISTLKA